MPRLNASMSSRARNAANVLQALLVCGVFSGVLASGVFLPLTRGYAQEQTVLVPENECRIKYVYLYSFALLTIWPDGAFDQTDNNFVIGVFGEKPFGEILDAIAKRKTIKGRRIVIRRFEQMDDYEPCHILYVTRNAASANGRDIVTHLDQDPVLIVGETPEFETTGGVIGFHFEEGKVRFNLNVTTAQERKLIVTGRLSRLARKLVKDSVTTAEAGSKR